MQVRQLKSALGVLVLLAGLSNAEAGLAESPNDIVVFVNKAAPVAEMSVDELKQIFLKKKTTWRNGDSIVCINAQDADPSRELFRQKVLEMSKSEELEYWEKEKMRKQLSMPAEMSNLAKAVFKIKNAVGYAYRKDVPTDVVKVVLIIPE